MAIERAPRFGSERRSDLEEVTARLMQLGATGDEVRAFAEHWDDLDDEWTVEARAEFVRLPDARLREALEAVRTEYLDSTLTEEQAAERAAAIAYRDALNEAYRRVGGTVPDVLAWVGGDPARARAVLDLETSSDGQARKTLIGPLQQVLNGS